MAVAQERLAAPMAGSGTITDDYLRDALRPSTQRSLIEDQADSEAEA